MSRVTTRQAAEELGISDAMVRYYEKAGQLDVARAGNRGQPTLYTSDSVRALGIRLRTGKQDQAIRTVTIHESLERERLALEVSGLTVRPVRDMLHALDINAYHRPILIWPDTVEGMEHVLFDKFVTRVHAVVVGDPKKISERAAKYASWVEPGELRELTIHVWEIVDRRHRNATLRL